MKFFLLINVKMPTTVGILREADCKHRPSGGNSKFCILFKISRFKALDERLRLVKNQSNTSNGSRDIHVFTVAMATIFRPSNFMYFREFQREIVSLLKPV